LTDSIESNFEETFGEKLDWDKDNDTATEYVKDYMLEHRIFNIVVDVKDKRVYVRPNLGEKPSSSQLKTISDWAIKNGWNEEIIIDVVVASNMNWYKKAIGNQKILILARGLPGSGKSTLAKGLGKGGVILSSDDFFMVNGKYEFDKSGQGYAHFWNQGRAEEAMKQEISPIVIDNTNVEAWEMKPYVLMAQKYGYQVELTEPNTPWKFDAEELTKRNTHGVPKEAIDGMIEKWEPDITIEDILQSEKEKEPK